METSHENTPQDVAWEDARRRYETTDEPVTVIAASLGLSQLKLVHEARRRKWSLRRTKVRKPTTKVTLQTVRDTLQKRLAQFEQQIDALGQEASAAASEKDIRAMNLLVRTLEKVLDLERKDRSQRNKLSRERKRLDDAGREELIRRIEALQAQGEGSLAGERAGGVEG